MKKTALILLLVVTFILILSSKALTREPAPSDRAFTVKSVAFNANGTIPNRYVCKDISEGQNISLPLQWSGAPANTKSYAIFMYDLNPVAKNFVHWAVINIPSQVTSIQEGVSATAYMPKGSIELPNSTGRIGYWGPCPPAGTGNHQYKITVYALNTSNLSFSGRTSLAQFQAAIDGKTLAQAELSGYFELK